MSTQTFDLQWNDIPAGKSILSKSEIITYCSHFGQATHELDDFLNRFDFEEWICMELFVDYVYGKIDKKGEVGSDAVKYLSLIATTFLSEEGELALQNYLGYDTIGFDYPQEDATFVTFDDCPLWMIQITENKKQYSSGIFFMPAVFWKGSIMTEESYGYGKYIVKHKYGQWYSDSFGKNQLQNQYWRNRIGSYSPNFINREAGIAIDFKDCPLYFDGWENRIIFFNHEKKSIIYYNLLEPEKWIELKHITPITYGTFIVTTPDTYVIYLKDRLITTDKNFVQITETATQTFNYFEDDYWKIILDNKGILMTKKQLDEEKRFKYNELKISRSLNGPAFISICVNGNQSVIFYDSSLSIVDSSFTVTNITLDKVFKKQIPLYLNGMAQHTNVTLLSPDRQLIFTSYGVFELGKDKVPIMIQNKLTAITGEVLFYNALKDDDFQGIWFVAGNDRLIFTDEHFTKGYIFNFSEQIFSPKFNEYRVCNLLFDNEQNLWYSLVDGKLYKISRKELGSKLKTAVPYAIKN